MKKASKHSFGLLILIIIGAVHSLAQQPQLYVQTGHSNPLRAVAFSPDGKLLASGGEDGNFKLWDVLTGQELRSFVGHSGMITDLAFSPDGSRLISGSSDSAKIWDVATGNALVTQVGHQSGVHSVAYSHDGRLVASASVYDIIVWDPLTGREVRRFATDKGEVAQTIAFSPDSKTIACGTWWKVIKIWDISSGEKVQTLRGHGQLMRSISFSANGKMLASGSDDKTIKIWELSSGKVLRSLSDSDSVYSVMFASDGKTLVSGGGDNAVKLWDVEKERVIRTYTGHKRPLMSVTLSLDGRMIASGGGDQTIKVWDKNSGQLLRTLAGNTAIAHSIAFSPNGGTLAVGDSNATIKFWDLTNGRALRSVAINRGEITGVTFSPDGKIIASANFGTNSVTLVDTASGRELGELSGQAKKISSIKFSPDGQLLASASEDNSVWLWNVSDRTVKVALVGDSRRSKTSPASITAVAFSPDGKYLAMAEGFTENAEPAAIWIWDLNTRQRLRRLVGQMSFHTLTFSPDSSILASGDADDHIKLWNVANGSEVRTLDGHSDTVATIAFSPDGRLLASGSWDTTVTLWDPNTGRLIHTLKSATAWVNEVAFSPNGRFLAAGSADAKTYLWEIPSGKELASLIAIGQTDWAVVSPDGLFDGSPSAWRQLVWRFSSSLRDIVPVEAFFNEFYHPDLLPEIISGKAPVAPQNFSQKDRGQAEVILSTREKPGASISAKEVTIGLNVMERAGANQTAGSGARDVRLFRNGSLVKFWRGDVLQGQGKVKLEARVKLLAGSNEFTAYAFNRDNIKSSDATLAINGGENLRRKGVGYVLAVGVNQYANGQYNLKYAVADAQDFAEELKRQQAKLNNYERVEVIALNDQDATKANILKALSDLAAKVQPEDAVVIFFAGHGTAQQNRFYLIPQDLGYAGSRTELGSAGLQEILSHSVSDEEISRAVEGIDAGQMLLVIDACNSGQALEAEEKRRGPMNSKGLAQLAYEKGMYILTAAQSYQAANEAERYGHGFLTYALVEEGLKTNAADREPKDGQVLLREWLDFATQRVPQMQEDKLQEQQKQGRQLDRIKFAEADSGNERSIQRPRVFYRRETEMNPLVVAGSSTAVTSSAANGRAVSVTRDTATQGSLLNGNTQPQLPTSNGASTNSSGDTLTGTVWKGSVSGSFEADGIQNKKASLETMRFRFLPGGRFQLSVGYHGSIDEKYTPIEGTWKQSGNAIYMRHFQVGSTSCAFEYNGEISNGQIVGRTTYVGCGFGGHAEWRLQLPR